MIYLSSTTAIPDQYRTEFGVMFSANKSIGGLNDALVDGWQWMMDNNGFTGDFDTRKWLSALLRYWPHRETCLGIPIPDVMGNALATLRQFSQYWRVVADLGYPVAFVTQDGITPEITPWDHFETLFVGGTDEHKLGPEASIMIAEAKARGKWVHIGRVNSVSRIKQFWMADSVDGTHLTREFKKQAKKIHDFANAVQYCRNRKTGRIGIDGQHQILEVLQ